MSSREITIQSPDAAEPIEVHRGGIIDRIEEVWHAVARRAFEIFEAGGKQDGNDLDNWLTAERELLSTADTELSEKDNEITIKAQVPGFSQKDLKVLVEPQKVLIKGHVHEQKDNKTADTVYSEQSDRQICQSVDLPATVNLDNVNATLTGGVLTIVLTKAAAGQTPPGESAAKAAGD